jgi:hypothetical protein
LTAFRGSEGRRRSKNKEEVVEQDGKIIAIDVVLQKKNRTGTEREPADFKTGANDDRARLCESRLTLQCNQTGISGWNQPTDMISTTAHEFALL